MEKIKFFLKFGKKEHLKDLLNHQLYFNNAIALRGIEEDLKRKGQGDRLEGSTKLFATDSTIISHDGTQEIHGLKGQFTIHFEPANNIPVFCLFSVYEKDCSIGEDGTYTISLSDEIKHVIREHFPEANAVVVITDPDLFLHEIEDSIGVNCKMEQVHYFNIESGLEVKGSNTPAMDMEYMKYLTQDIVPTQEGKMKKYSVMVEHVFRSLFCKDVFFKGEQEFRILLPDTRIDKAKKYSVHFSEELDIYDLDSFLESH